MTGRGEGEDTYFRTQPVTYQNKKEENISKKVPHIFF